MKKQKLEKEESPLLERNQKSKKVEKVAGGFKIESDFKEPSEVGDEIPEEEEVSIPSEVVAINEALVETSVKVIGKVVELITKIPEMNFDEEEVQQLTRLWSPLIPTMSPVLGAVVGTLIIVSGKVVVYKAVKGKVVEIEVTKKRKIKKEKRREEQEGKESELSKSGDKLS